MTDDDIMAATLAELQKEGIKPDLQDQDHGEEVQAQEGDEGQKPSEERVLNEFEQEQKAKGWDPNGEKSAEEWANWPYKKLSEKTQQLEKAEKKLVALERTMKNLTSLMEKQEKHVTEKVRKELQAQWEAAVHMGNHEQVKEIEQQQAELDNGFESNIPPQAAVDFQSKYEKIFKGTDFESIEIADFLNRMDGLLFSRHQGKMDPEEHFTLLEQQMFKKFPDYFGIKDNKSLAKTQVVESGSGSHVIGGIAKKATGWNDLTPEQKQVASDFERAGVMTKKQYIEKLIELGDL